MFVAYAVRTGGKQLVWYLRHRQMPADEDGFTPWDDLARVSRIGSLGRAEIGGMLAQADGRIVARLFLGVLLLRATRGHSNHTVPVLSSLESPAPGCWWLGVHGTSVLGARQIVQGGISPMGRDMVHLTPLSRQACTGSLFCFTVTCPI